MKSLNSLLAMSYQELVEFRSQLLLALNEGFSDSDLLTALIAGVRIDAYGVFSLQVMLHNVDPRECSRLSGNAGESL